MAPRQCICGQVIPFDGSQAPVTMLDRLKFYKDSSEFGHPTTKRKIFLCGKHTQEFIHFLKEVTYDGPSEDVAE